MASITPTDRIRLRTVGNQSKRIQEHLEAIQRDIHGLEYASWRKEIDALWKDTFGNINKMKPEPQQQALEMIRELWVTFVSHYNVIPNR